MEKEFVNYNQALKLKELGFDEPCFGFYDGKGDTTLYFNNKRDASGDFEPFIKNQRLSWFGAPTFSQAFRWFRKKYKLSTSIVTHNIDYYEWHIFRDGFSLINSSGSLYNAYEEAELECLIKLIKIVKSYGKETDPS